MPHQGPTCWVCPLPAPLWGTVGANAGASGRARWNRRLVPGRRWRILGCVSLCLCPYPSPPTLKGGKAVQYSRSNACVCVFVCLCACGSPPCPLLSLLSRPPTVFQLLPSLGGRRFHKGTCLTWMLEPSEHVLFQVNLASLGLTSCPAPRSEP